MENSTEPPAWFTEAMRKELKDAVTEALKEALAPTIAQIDCIRTDLSAIRADLGLVNESLQLQARRHRIAGSVQELRRNVVRAKSRAG